MTTATTPERDTWLAGRKRGIGGSDVHHLWSLEPYGCRRMLWYDKTDAPADFPEAVNQHMRRGIELEPLVADLYARGAKRKVRRAGQRWHKSLPNLLVNPDREICRSPGDVTPGVLEIKCPSQRTYLKVKREGLPDSWQLQVQHALLVTGYEWAVVAIFSAELWDLTLVPVLVDRELQGRIRDEVPRFWRQVENGPAPDRLDQADARCKACRWRTTCQGQTEINMAIPEDFAEELPQDPGLAPLVREYQQLKQLQEEAGELAQEAGDRLREALGDRQAVQTDGARIYYRSASQTRIDTAALRKECPDLAKRYERTTLVRSLRVFPM